MKLFNVTWRAPEHVTEFRDTCHALGTPSMTMRQSIISPDHCSRWSSTLHNTHYCPLLLWKMSSTIITVLLCGVIPDTQRWDKKNNKEINIEIIYTHVNIPSVLHASTQTPHPHHRAMIGLIPDIRDWKSSGIMRLKSGSHDSHIFLLFTTTPEVKLKEIAIVFQKLSYVII